MQRLFLLLFFVSFSLFGQIGTYPPASGGAGTDDQTAAEVPSTPSGDIAASDVDAAIAEIASEKTTPAAALTAANIAIQKLIPLLAVDAGANDTYTVTLNPVPAAITDAPLIWFIPNTANTGAAGLDIGPGASLQIYQNVDGGVPDDDDLLPATPILLKYCAACNTAAGAWIYDDLRGAPKNVTAGAGCPSDGVLLAGSDGLTTCIPTSLTNLPFTIPDPVVAVSSFQRLALPNFTAATITSVDCVCEAAGACTVSLNFDSRAKTAPTTPGTDVHTSEIVADADNTTETSLAGDTTMAANEVLNLSISAVTGAPTKLVCYVNVEPN